MKKCPKKGPLSTRESGPSLRALCVCRLGIGRGTTRTSLGTTRTSLGTTRTSLGTTRTSLRGLRRRGSSHTGLRRRDVEAVERGVGVTSVGAVATKDGDRLAIDREGLADGRALKGEGVGVSGVRGGVVLLGRAVERAAILDATKHVAVAFDLIAHGEGLVLSVNRLDAQTGDLVNDVAKNVLLGLVGHVGKLDRELVGRGTRGHVVQGCYFCDLCDDIGGSGSSLSGLVTSDRSSLAPSMVVSPVFRLLHTGLPQPLSLSRCWRVQAPFQGVAVHTGFAVYQRRFYMGYCI